MKDKNKIKNQKEYIKILESKNKELQFISGFGNDFIDEITDENRKLKKQNKNLLSEIKLIENSHKKSLKSLRDLSDEYNDLVKEYKEATNILDMLEIKFVKIVKITAQEQAIIDYFKNNVTNGEVKAKDLLANYSIGYIWNNLDALI